MAFVLSEDEHRREVLLKSFPDKFQRRPNNSKKSDGGEERSGNLQAFFQGKADEDQAIIKEWTLLINDAKTHTCLRSAVITMRYAVRASHPLAEISFRFSKPQDQFRAAYHSQG